GEGQRCAALHRAVGADQEVRLADRAVRARLGGDDRQGPARRQCQAQLRTPLRWPGWYPEARQRSDRLAIDVEDERRTAIVTHHETQMRRADKRRTRKYWQRPSSTRADKRASPEHDHHAQNNRTASRTRVHEQRIPDHIVSLRRTAPLVRPSFATTCRRQPTAISRCC